MQFHTKMQFNIQKVSLKMSLPLTLLFFSVFLGVPINAVGTPITPRSTELQAGLEYQKFTTKLGQIVHVMKVDPQKIKVMSVYAKDNGIEEARTRLTVKDLAKRYHAIAALNGGFFHGGPFRDGLPAGILKSQNRWIGITKNNRAAIGWSQNGKIILIDKLKNHIKLYLNHHLFPVHGLNQPASANKAILYNDAFGPKADAIANGIDVVFQNDRIIDIRTSNKTSIPQGGYVYVLGPDVTDARLSTETLKKYLKPGTVAKLSIEVIPVFSKEKQKTWEQLDNIIGGIPLLIQNGKMVSYHQGEKFGKNFSIKRHARTSAGILKNGHFIFAVAEQSAMSGSPGMSIKELQNFLLAQGVTQAINLDGGGSSTLYVNNKVINNPQGDVDEDLGLRVERPVSDAIVMIPK